MEAVEDTTTAEVIVDIPALLIPVTSKEEQDAIDDNASTGRWTQSEHEIFLEGLKIHSKNWKLISEMVKTRTVVQIRTHAQKYFQKLEKSKQRGSGGSGETADSGDDLNNADALSAATATATASSASSSSSSSFSSSSVNTAFTVTDNTDPPSTTTITAAATASTTTASKKSRARSASEGASRKRPKKSNAKSTKTSVFSDELDILLENIDWHTTAAVDSVTSISSSSSGGGGGGGGHVFMPGQSKYHDAKAHANFSKMIREYKFKVQTMNASNGSKEDPMENFHLLPRYIKSVVVPPSLTLIDKTFCHYPLTDEPDDAAAYSSFAVGGGSKNSSVNPTTTTDNINNRMRSYSVPSPSSSEGQMHSDISGYESIQLQQPSVLSWFPALPGADEQAGASAALSFQQQQYRQAMHSVSFDDVHNSLAAVNQQQLQHSHMVAPGGHFAHLTVMTHDLPTGTAPFYVGPVGANASTVATGTMSYRESTPPAVIHSVTPPSSVSPKSADKKKRGRALSKKAIAAANKAARAVAAAATTNANANNSSNSDAFVMPTPFHCGQAAWGGAVGAESPFGGPAGVVGAADDGEGEDEAAFNFDGALDELHVSEDYLESLIKQSRSPSAGITTTTSITTSSTTPSSSSSCVNKAAVPHAQQQLELEIEQLESMKTFQASQYIANIVSPSETFHSTDNKPSEELAYSSNVTFLPCSFPIVSTTATGGQQLVSSFEGDELVDNMLELFE